MLFRPKCFEIRGRLHGMSVPNGRMSAGTSGRKLPLWADFSVLNTVSEEKIH